MQTYETIFYYPLKSEMRHTVTLSSIAPQDKKPTKYQIENIVVPFPINICPEYENNKIRISNVGNSSWVTVTIPDAHYNIETLNNIITAEFVNRGWANIGNVPLSIGYNKTNNLIITTLDSTKLKTGTQVAIDFTASDIYVNLGYNGNTATFYTDGLKISSRPYFFDPVVLQFSVSNIGQHRITNDESGDEIFAMSHICSIPIQNAELDKSLIVFPSNETQKYSFVHQAPITLQSSAYNIICRGRDYLGKLCPVFFNYGYSLFVINYID